MKRPPDLRWLYALPILLLIWTSSAPCAWGDKAVRKPKIRAITALVRIDRAQYRHQMQQALSILRAAKTAFEKGGFEVQTIRITTQPFAEYVHGLSQTEALNFFTALDELARQESFLLNIGPLEIGDREDSSLTNLLGKVLATTRLNSSLAVAGEDGVHWVAVRVAAEVIKYVENHSPNGVGNFDFAAVAMAPPGGPFYPGSVHHGPGRQFSVGWEAGAFVTDVLADIRGDAALARERLSRRFEEQAVAVEAIAGQVEKDSGWIYVGLDPTPAPNSDSSIGAAIEQFTGTKFGASGTLTAAAVITEAERSISVKRAGYSGLMLPVLEDPVLAQRWSEGSFDLDSLLAYSAACGTGLDAIPLPGDVSQPQLTRIIGDMASLAFKWHKPLTARLIPAPGRRAGERTDFDFGVGQFPNVVLQPLR